MKSGLHRFSQLKTSFNVLFLNGFIVSALSAFAPVAFADAPVMLIHDYEAEGRRYSAVTIITRGDASEHVPVYPNLEFYQTYADRFLRTLNRWVPEQYIDRQIIKRGDDTHRALTQEESLLDGRSAIVFLTEWNNLSKILAFIRVSRFGSQTNNFNPPLELRNPNVHFDRPDLRLVSLHERVVVEGEYGELKNFIQPPDTDRNYLGFLIHHAAQMGVFEHTFRKVYFEGRLQPVMPRYFAIETHPTMVRFLRGLDFEDMPEFSDPSKAFQNYMKIDLARIYQAPEKLQRSSSLRKPPIPVVDEKIKLVSWKPVGLPDPDNCVNKLVKVPFFKPIGLY